jgi:5-methylcytosine-specific restriction endonuclease McrA
LADKEYKRFSCAGCGILGRVAGGLQKHCKPCAQENKKRPPKLIVCKTCTKVFAVAARSSRRAAYCSAECKRVGINRRDREVYAATPRAPKERPPPRPCRQCGVQYSPVRRDDSFFCSSTCKRLAHQPRIGPPADERRRLSGEKKARLAAEMAVRLAASKQRKAEVCAMRLAARQAKQRATMSCARCGVQWCRLVLQRNICKYCPECAAVEAKEFKAASRLIGKIRKRAATVEAVNPYRVFRRDGWRCYLCGCDTPEELRGKHMPNSPELEHVVPIARGGEHSYANVRCSCRACNLIKGDRTADEVGGAAYAPPGGVKSVYTASPSNRSVPREIPLTVNS